MTRRVLLRVMRVHSSYDYLLLTQQIPNSVSVIPTFSEYTYDELVEKDYLVPEGKEAISRILWTLSKFSSIDYGPEIVPIVSLLLFYLSEPETYKIIIAMLKDSADHNPHIRWHFSVDYNNHMKLVTAMAEYILTAIRSIKLNVEDIIGIIDRMYRLSLIHI